MFHADVVRESGRSSQLLFSSKELATLEEHLLWCGACVDRAEAVAQYVDARRCACARSSPIHDGRSRNTSWHLKTIQAADTAQMLSTCLLSLKSRLWLKSPTVTSSAAI